MSKKRKAEISTLTPKTFSLDQKTEYLQHLEEEGFVVIRDILTEEEKKERLELFWKDWTSVSPKFDRYDPST